MCASEIEKLCFRCISPNHWANRCKKSKPCNKCLGYHHTLLHKDSGPSNLSPSTTEASLIGTSDHHTMFLGTALVHVRDQLGCMQEVRTLIDTAYQINIISSNCANSLGLRRTKWTVPFTGLSGVSVSGVEGIVDCSVSPRYNYDHNIQIQAWILPKVTNNMPSRHVPSTLKSKFSHLALADPFFDCSSPVNLLLGADVFAQILDGKRVVIKEGFP